jgi:hypothetical protein
VAWAEHINRGAGLDGGAFVVRLAAFPAGRVVRQRVVWTGRGTLHDSIGIAVNRWRDVVWSVPRGVWLWRSGRAPRLLADGRWSAAPRLQLYDGGRTVAWDAEHVLDLRAPRQRHGCPRRAGFATVASTARALVTRARLPDEDHVDDFIVWRTCWRAEHRDHVVFAGDDADPDNEFAGHGLRDRAAGYAEPWLLLDAERWSKYGDHDERLILVDVTTGGVTVVADGRDDVDQAVLLGDGSVAWMSTSRTAPSTVALRLARRGTRPIDLDSGSALTALSASGNTLSWLHDGQPRTYVVPGR